MSGLRPLNILVLLMLVRNCQGGPSASVCGSEWTDSGSRCYRYYVGKQSYVDAITTCQGEGGQLAHAASEAENTALSALMTVSSIWLGMHRKVSEKDTWVLSNGETATYFDWKSGEPNNHGGFEDCVEMKSDGKWNDIPCFYQKYLQHSFICFQELPTKPTKNPPEPTTSTDEDNSAISATIAGVGGALVGAIAGFCVGRLTNKGKKEARNFDDIDRTSMPPSHSQFYPDDSRTFQTLANGSRTDQLSTRLSGTNQLSTRLSGTDQLPSTGYAMPQLASNSSRMHHLSTAGSRIDQVSRSSLYKGQSGSRLFNN